MKVLRFFKSRTFRLYTSPLTITIVVLALGAPVKWRLGIINSH